jgi:hypothetical protein
MDIELEKAGPDAAEIHRMQMAAFKGGDFHLHSVLSFSYLLFIFVKRKT